MHANEGREATTTHFLQLFPRCEFQSKFHRIFVYFSNFFDIMSKRRRYKFKVLLNEVFVDEGSNFDL